MFGEWPGRPAWPALLLHEWAGAGAGLVGLGASLLARDRLTAIVSLGIQGFAVALIFLLFGAPDLAFTQFMVETLSVVILALVMTRLKLSPADRRPAWPRLLDGAVALACGVGLGLLLMQGRSQLPFDGTSDDILRGQRQGDRPRPQHRQRHHRRLPRPRHAGRNRRRR